MVACLADITDTKLPKAQPSTYKLCVSCLWRRLKSLRLGHRHSGKTVQQTRGLQTGWSRMRWKIPWKHLRLYSWAFQFLAICLFIGERLLLLLYNRYSKSTTLVGYDQPPTSIAVLSCHTNLQICTGHALPAASSAAAAQHAKVTTLPELVEAAKALRQRLPVHAFHGHGHRIHRGILIAAGGNDMLAAALSTVKARLEASRAMLHYLTSGCMPDILRATAPSAASSERILQTQRNASKERSPWAGSGHENAYQIEAHHQGFLLGAGC